jgi:hypothetical protein
MMKIIITSLLVVAGAVCVHAGVSWKAEIFVAEPIENCSIWQEQILYEYETGESDSVKARNAYILSQLWEKGLLRNEIKDFLVDKYYKLVLLQPYGNYHVPNLVVQCQQTFPFPSNWVRFTPTMYRNGRVQWAPDRPQKEHAMSQNSSIITSWTGGAFENSDVVFYQIKIDEKRNKQVVWERVVTTNEVVLEGLKAKQPDRERAHKRESPNR